VQAYRNKWPVDWANFWFYHKIRLDPETNSSPLWIEWIPQLPKTPVVAPPDTAEAYAFMAVLRVAVKSFSIRDLIEELSVCQVFPVHEGWAFGSWAAEEKWVEGILMPDFTACFGIGREGALFFFDHCLWLCFQTLIRRPSRLPLTKLLALWPTLNSNN
jgi:hypothetical protein